METVIYLDILFIVNFSMDFLVLCICAKLLHYDLSFATLLLCSGIGAVYGVAEVFLSGGAIVDILINIALSALICFIAFGLRSVLILVRNTLVLYGVGFALGGSMTALYYALNKSLNRNINTQIETEALTPINIKTFIPIAAVCVLLVYIFNSIISKHQGEESAKIHIEFSGRSVELVGLCDSGNLLCEPLSGLPCAVCEYDKIKELFDIGFRKMFEESDVRIMEYVGSDMAKKLRIIPLCTVGSSGILVGFIPDKVTINGEKKKICIACEKNTDGFGGYDCILPRV